MSAISLPQMERNIARCRVFLSIAAIIVVYMDPEEPLVARWVQFVSGSFTMDWRLFVVMALHLTYSVTFYLGLGRVFSARAVDVTTWIDVLFAVAIATMTEGVTSPSYPFFAFAVLAAGLRGGFRPAMRVTVVSLGLYLGLIVISTRGGADVYVMRPVYLAIVGYLAGYLGQQHMELQDEMRELEVVEQRHRIARELHDGYAQALAGINLRLEGARRLLKADASAEALSDLTELQDSVKREYDHLRRYARSLAGVEFTPSSDGEDGTMRLRVSAEVSGPASLIDHILGIAREGISNVRRHSRAKTAKIEIRGDRSAVCINIEDDGIGFPEGVTPWSIAARVKEMGGQLHIAPAQQTGAHLLITLPQA